MNNIDLNIIIPAFLEEENLRLLLPRLKDTLEKTYLVCEVLIIDTISPLDNTKSVCEEFGAIYISRKENNSYGSAIREGIRNSKGEFIIFMDSDGSHSPEFITKMLEYKDEFDVVIASRYVEGGFTENGKILTFMSRVLNYSYSIILNLKCKDVSNSFKLYRSNLVKGQSYSCDNFDIVEEILFKVAKNQKNLKIKEIPYTFKSRIFGKTKRNLLLFIITYIFTILKLRFSK
jgi:dolichol-phosphate mannosyltransferase